MFTCYKFPKKMLTQSEKQQLRQMGLNKPNWEENNKRNVLFGISVLALLATSGAGAPAAIYIMECIGWSWLAMAGKLDPSIFTFFQSLSLPQKKKILWNYTDYMVQFQSYSRSTLPALIKKIGMTTSKKSNINCPLNFDLLNSLNNPTLFHEEYKMAVAYNSVLLKIDAIPYFDHSLVKFNPTYELLIISLDETFNVLAYDGMTRRERGPLVFVYHNHSDNKILSAEWSPNGEYILVIISQIDPMYQHQQDHHSASKRKIILFKYDYVRHRMQELSGCEDLIISSIQSSSCLWINNNSFLMPTSWLGPLLIIKINKQTKTISSTTIFPICNMVRDLTMPNYKILYSGCFFTGLKFQPLLFWITNCIDEVTITRQVMIISIRIQY